MSGQQEIHYSVVAGSYQEVVERVWDKLKSFAQPTQGDWVQDWDVDWTAHEYVTTEQDDSMGLVEADVTARRM